MSARAPLIGGVPRGPLLLTAAGLLPFLWGLATFYSEPLASWTVSTLGGRFTAPFVSLSYGQVILAFMSGVLWGFATRGTAVLPYVLSVIPALWAFFMVGGGPVTAAVNLIAGFLALLLLDWHFARDGLAPRWWMSLRVPVTLGVVLCLLPLALA